ncbi:salutaridine reductase-like isoform X2 [Magnolia sinica]|uniref:salutaridine reductase-like isoform X2 n=1 Tax=Magnolia sinica TaxID=86752 RepID=UPI00265B21E3|nr:salutaridine reductase-like isoform X2 [Magnolia sinica]
MDGVDLMKVPLQWLYERELISAMYQARLQDKRRAVDFHRKTRTPAFKSLVSSPFNILGLHFRDGRRNHVPPNFEKVNNAGVSGVIVDCEALRALKLGAGEVVGEKSELVKGVMQQTYEKAEECLKTNYYGCKAVIEALLPLLQLSSSARIVNVSSNMGQLKFISNPRAREYLDGVDVPTEEKVEEVLQWFLKDFKEDLLGPNGWPTMLSAYSVSKAALNAYTRILAKKYPGFCINCVNPGFVKTDINCNTGILTVEDGAKAPVMLALLPDSGPSGLFFDQMELSTFA